jgi:signal peptidase II
MFLGQEYHILGHWFILHFTENNGMAFGMEFGGDYGKLFLSTFRLLFVCGLFWYLHKMVKEKADTLFITCLSLIIAGAVGNLIDSTFYGMIFSSSDFQIAQLLPPEGGYSGLFYGKVVDMLYFPLIRGHFPEWFPVWSGEGFEFFRPVFNIADSSISIGVMLWIIFQKRFSKHLEKPKEILQEETN